VGSYIAGRRGVSEGPTTVISERGVPIQAPKLGMGSPDTDAEHMSPPAVRDYLQQLGSDNSRRAARQALDRTLRLLGEDTSDMEATRWWRLTSVHLKVVRRHLITSDYSTATINLTLSVLRALSRVLNERGHLSDARYKGITGVKGPRIDFPDEPDVRFLDEDEIDRVFGSCREEAERGDPAGVRDAAVLRLLCAGLRREEVAGLTLDDLDLDAEESNIVVQLEERAVALEEDACEALEAWLNLRGFDAGPLWSQIRKGGHLVLPPTGMSGQSVFNLCRRRAEKAGLSRTFTPHDLRRTFREG